MPCLLSKADSVLNDSIRVPNAASQLAVPLMMATFLASSVISSPNGSAVWTGAVAGGGVAGVWAVAGGGAEGPAAGAGVSVGAGAGVAGAAGTGGAWVLGAGVAAGGDCASAALRASEIAAGISATMARRKKLLKFIQVISKAVFKARGRHITSAACPGSRRQRCRHANTRGPLSSHDRYVMVLPARLRARRRTHWPIRRHWPYKAGTNREI